jgi:O-glycosyl hydrolase
VEVAEWDRLDGSLSFQWYAFDKLQAFYEKDIEGKEIEPIQGATSSSYTPSITPVAGKTFYFYVEVTNTNSNAINGPTWATITSDVATITFNESGKPAAPIITQNPANSTYTLGRQAAIAALEVRTEVSAMYQWYSFKLADGFNTDGTPKGTLIAGATQRTYLPARTDLSAGDNYYYVVTTSVTLNGEGFITAKSDRISTPAIITMELGAAAVPPRILEQPKDILYFTGENKTADGAAKLSVSAASVDSGTLSYQWYSNTTATQTGATLITDATADELIPDISTASAGTKYYYVIVTNTNDLVTGNTTEALASKIVPVKVMASAGALTANATITPTPATRYQYIRGYGGMETTWGNFFQSDANDMENMFNPDILGYNIWRIMIPPVSTNVEDIKTYVMARDYANRYYENPKVVNKYGGYVLASPWSPPKEWKSNNSINSGGHLLKQYRKQYAAYLRSFARHMSNEGAPIYAVSIANEPNYAGGYDGCEWEPEEMRDFWKEVGYFTQGVRGYGGGKVIPSVLTVNGESANTPDINHSAMGDPVSNAAIGLFARHVYGEQRKVLWGHPNLNGREVWMTEHNINSASATAFPNDSTYNYIWRFMNDVDLVIRLNNENAFVWWVVKRFYSFIGDNDASTIEHQILPRAWGMAHYSKFTIDTTRIGVNVTGNLGTTTGPAIVVGTNVNSTDFNLDNQSVKITAFVSQNGNEISLVMWTPTATDGSGGSALGTAKIDMPAGFKIRGVSAMRSRAGSGGGGSRTVENMGQNADASVSVATDRLSAYITLPRSEMVSVKFIKE